MRALTIGADLQLPAGHTAHALVHACFDHAAHLLLEDGRLLTLLAGTAQRGMRIINVAEADWPRLRQYLCAGTHAQLTRDALRHARFELPLTGVTVWQAGDISGSALGPSAASRDAMLQTCHAWLRARLGVVVPGMPAPTHRFWQAAHAAFGRTLDSVFIDGHALDHAVRDALGLGPGLTPSADDMIAGLMIGLRAAQAPREIQARLSAAVRRHWDGTTMASCDALEQAMCGWTCNRLADVCATLSRPASARDIETVLDAQAAIGHFSGVDTLIGWLAGLEACLPGRSDPRARAYVPNACLGGGHAPARERMQA